MSSNYTWDEVAKSNEVHEETLGLTKFFKDNKLKMFHEFPTLEECRTAYDEFLHIRGPFPFDGSVSEKVVPSSGSQPVVPITVYEPSNKVKVPKILVYLHGGGLVFGSPHGYSRAMQKLAVTTGSVVVAVKYRLLPDSGDKYTPSSDCYHAVRWVLANKEAVGGTSSSKIGVIGDSAGGGLAILAALDISGLDFSIPIYPLVDLCTDESFKEFNDVPIFNSRDVDWVAACFEPLEVSPNDERIVPNARVDVKAPLPTLMIVADLDPLRDSALKYGERMKKAGAKITVSNYTGVPHGFFAAFDFYPTKAGKAYDEIAAFIAAL